MDENLTTADEWDEELGAAAASILYDNVANLADVVDDSDTLLADALKWCQLQESEGLEGLAQLAADVQNAKRALALIEHEVARAAGQMKRGGVQPSGVLASGKPYELKRATTRKAWDHGAWKGAVLNRVLEDRGLDRYAVNPSTGEEVDLGQLVADVQGVHGSTAPRVTALRSLGLEPGEFCTETPGPWAFYVK